MTSTPSPSREALCGKARARPLDARAQIDAAYACDRDGAEEEAAVFYDAAWKLGVPSEQRAEFLIGSFPNAARAFLALTLHASGRSSEAVAELSSLLLMEGSPQEGVAAGSWRMK